MKERVYQLRRFQLGCVVATILLLWGCAPEASEQPVDPGLWSGNTGVYSPAHASYSDAVRHFFHSRPPAEPQPIAFNHFAHVQEIFLPCDFCHAAVAKGPKATVPGLAVCLSCHEGMGADHPEWKKLAEYQERNEEIPWKRVYGWNDEAHVRFNHAPHIRGGVTCETCHGDVSRMGGAQRVIEHTMGFCVDCHKQRQAPNDCSTCHY